MIYYNGFCGLVIKLGRKDGACALSIDNDKHACGPDKLKRLLHGTDAVVILLAFGHAVERALDSCIRFIKHYIAAAVCALAQTHKPQSRANAVHIGVLVAHYEHHIRIFHKLAQRLCKKPCLYAGLSREGYLLLPAEEGIVRATLYNGLVSPAAERKLHCLPCGFVAVRNLAFGAHGY